MKYALLLSALIELIGGLVLYLAPEMIMGTGSYLSRIYAVSAITLVLINPKWMKLLPFCVSTKPK